jgi:hypothetical protein
VLVLLVLAALVPSGLVMATQAFAGPIAGIGFGALSLATGASAAATVYYAIARRYALHERWANRCVVLLISPLLLRLAAGFMSVMGWESDWAYRANAWLSWLIPLAVYEIWRHWPINRWLEAPRPRTGTLQEAMP